jgi:hypothetical protein
MSIFDQERKEEDSPELKVDDIIKGFNKTNDLHLMKASDLLGKKSQ